MGQNELPAHHLDRSEGACYTRPVPPTLFFNGRILTGEQLLSGTPRYVSAMLVEQCEIVATGDSAELLRSSPANSRPDLSFVDLHNAFTMPGFNDAHLHLGEGARLRREVNLLGARSLAEAMARVREAAARPAKNAWLTGGGWDETLWSPPVLPTRHDLDQAAGGRPAVLVRADVHLSVASSAALSLAGVTGATEAPPGSAIDREAAGKPSGILRERGARQLVEQHIPPVALADRVRDLRAVFAEALRCGITSVQDNSSDEDFAAICALHSAGELPLRVSEWLPFDASLAGLEQRCGAAPGDRRLRTTMLKAFLDGSLGSRTASLLAPYADAPEGSGIPLYTQETLEAMAIERAALGFQLGFHAIGDRALAMALRTFEAVRRAVPTAGRFRIEHAQTASPLDFARAREAGAIASMQPSHLLTDMRWTAARLGFERARRAHAWRSFAQAGVPLAFGTDFPVEPLSPFRGLYAAVTRRSIPGESLPDESDAFSPEQAVSLPEALHAYTQGSAFAEGAEHWKGMLAPGFVADFVVLDRDLLALSETPRRLLDTRVIRTVVGGETAYAAPGE